MEKIIRTNYFFHERKVWCYSHNRLFFQNRSNMRLKAPLYLKTFRKFLLRVSFRKFFYSISSIISEINFPKVLKLVGFQDCTRTFFIRQMALQSLQCRICIRPSEHCTPVTRHGHRTNTRNTSISSSRKYTHGIVQVIAITCVVFVLAG